MPKPIREIALALVYRGDQWLVAKRGASVHLAGLWEFPGGKLLPYETAQQAAVRELYEECAVRAQPLEALQVIVWEYEDRVLRITPVICRWDAGEPQALGNELCRWVDGVELQSLAMPPANAAIVQAALAWRSSHR